MARLTRADFFRKDPNKKFEFYSDFTNNFKTLPGGKHLARALDERSIQQSLKNIILTGIGERPFQPLVGCQIAKMLFDPNNQGEKSSLEFFIQSAIELNEPRVILVDIIVDNGETINRYHRDSNEVVITIKYKTINDSTTKSFTQILKRVR
jgi:phage baseplate assembly protein W